MTPWELIAAALLYLIVAARYFQFGDYGMSLAFAAYAIANVGFTYASIRPS